MPPLRTDSFAEPPMIAPLPPSDARFEAVHSVKESPIPPIEDMSKRALQRSGLIACQTIRKAHADRFTFRPGDSRSYAEVEILNRH